MKANSQAKTKAKQQQALIDLIVESIHDKKGLKVISLNLSELNDSMADHFIICEGTSAPHMRAIADNVTYKVTRSRLTPLSHRRHQLARMGIGRLF